MRVLKPFVPVLAIACLMFCGAFTSLAYAEEIADEKMMLAESCQHNWSSWEIDEQPDCSSFGSERRYCSLCWVTEHRSLPKTGHWWADWEIDKKATKFAPGKMYRFCEICDKREYRSIPKKQLTVTDKKAISSIKGFFKLLKKYEYKKMLPFYSSKTKDFVGSPLKSIYEKQFKKKLSYKILDVSSTKASATVRVKMTTPYAYSNYYNAFRGWYRWYFAKYPNVSKATAKSNLLNRLVKCVSGNKMHKTTITLNLKLKKTCGKWKITPSSDFKRRMDGGLQSAWRDFRNDYL